MSQRDGEDPDPTVDSKPSGDDVQSEAGYDPALTPTEAESSAHSDTTDQCRQLPQEFGRYRIKKKLGQGGMGAVYLAQDEKLQRSVAIKVPSFRAQEDRVVIERFYREARAAATLDHPNLCPVFDVGVIDDIHYLSMAYVEGRPLTSYVKRGGLPTRQVAALIRTIALALYEAHQKGVIHRDLKPANIMVNRRRQPVVMDFGLAQREQVDAKLTRTGTIVGTPAYMSPEQISSDAPVGPSSDVFSLGIIMYELLVGTPPFRGTDAFAVISSILTSDPKPPSAYRDDIEPDLEAICLRALRKKPEDRYASMMELADDLKRFIVGSTLPVTVEQERPPAPGSITDTQPSTSRRKNVPPEPSVPTPAAPPGEKTLVNQMFADITSSSPRVTSSRRTRRKKGSKKTGLWIGLVAAGVLAIIGFTLRPRSNERSSASATRAPAANSGTVTDGGRGAAKGVPERPSLNPPELPTEPAEEDRPRASPPTSMKSGSPEPPPPSDPDPPKPEPPPRSNKPDRPLLVNVDLPADAGGRIRVDGKADDWENFESVSDDRHDALDDELSRDIIHFAAEYTLDSLYVMIRTSSPPAIDNLAFWINIDLNGDTRYAFQVGLSSVDRHVLWRMPPDDEAYSENVSGVQMAIDDVVEFRIPWDWLRNDIPPSMAKLIPSDVAPLQVRLQCFSYVQKTDKRIDTTEHATAHANLTDQQRSESRVADAMRLGPPKWESIWIRDPNTPWALESHLTSSELAQSIKSNGRRNLSTIRLRGYTGDDGEPRFAGLWNPGPATDAAYALMRDELEARFLQGARKRLRPAFVSAYPWNGQVAFNAIWVQNVPQVASTWVYSSASTITPDYELATKQDLGVQGVTAWPNVNGEIEYLSLFANTNLRLGSRVYDEADYRQNIRNLAPNARPIYVDAFRVGNSLHYPVCWTYDSDKLPDWTVERTEGVSAFDDLVLRMRRQNYRPICFAVVR